MRIPEGKETEEISEVKVCPFSLIRSLDLCIPNQNVQYVFLLIFFVEIDKLILKYTEKYKGLRAKFS